MTETQTLLSVNDLSVEFKSQTGYVKAVNNISFEVLRGKTIGIVGESGSGKSVTGLTIMGLLPSGISRIAGGSIFFTNNEGEKIDLINLPEKQKRQFRGNQIAMIFQEPMTSLNPVYKCGRQVSEALILHKKLKKAEARKVVLEWFSEVKLPDPLKAYNSYPHQLSGGQRQRVMIALAMCCNPSLLIADEPTTALDVTVQKNILELMKQLQEKYNTSILFISHDLGVIAEIADEVIVAYKGSIVEKGPVLSIFKNPQHPYTKGLLACRPNMQERPEVLPTVDMFLNAKTEFSGFPVNDEQRKNRQHEMYLKRPILEIKNLKKSYITGRILFKAKKTFQAVNDVSFQVYPGETLGLVGESGCGKTTLGRTVLRLINPDSGKIVFFGKDITAFSQKVLRSTRKEMQIIFQDPFSSLNPKITVGKAITEAMKIHNIANGAAQRKQKAIQLLRDVNLDEQFFYRYPHELSGGQRQRICIARSLALEPRFVVCDESVSALDVSVQAQVLNLLNNLKKQYGFSMIFISHDLSVVKYMSDRILVMKNGSIIESGEADQLCRTPQNEYTRQLLEAIPQGL